MNKRGIKIFFLSLGIVASAFCVTPLMAEVSAEGHTTDLSFVRRELVNHITMAIKSIKKIPEDVVTGDEKRALEEYLMSLHDKFDAHQIDFHKITVIINWYYKNILFNYLQSGAVHEVRIHMGLFIEYLKTLKAIEDLTAKQMQDEFEKSAVVERDILRKKLVTLERRLGWINNDADESRKLKFRRYMIAAGLLIGGGVILGVPCYFYLKREKETSPQRPPQPQPNPSRVVPHPLEEQHTPQSHTPPPRREEGVIERQEPVPIDRQDETRVLRDDGLTEAQDQILGQYQNLKPLIRGKIKDFIVRSNQIIREIKSSDYVIFDESYQQLLSELESWLDGQIRGLFSLMTGRRDHNGLDGLLKDLDKTIEVSFKALCERVERYKMQRPKESRELLRMIKEKLDSNTGGAALSLTSAEKEFIIAEIKQCDVWHKYVEIVKDGEIFNKLRDEIVDKVKKKRASIVENLSKVNKIKKERKLDYFSTADMFVLQAMVDSNRTDQEINALIAEKEASYKQERREEKYVTTFWHSFLKSAISHEEGYVKLKSDYYTKELEKLIKSGVKDEVIQKKMKEFQEKILIVKNRYKAFQDMCQGFSFQPTEVYNGVWWVPLVGTLRESTDNFDDAFTSEDIGSASLSDAITFFDAKQEALKEAFARRIWDKGCEAHSSYNRAWQAYENSKHYEKDKTYVGGWRSYKAEFMEWLYGGENGGLQYVPGDHSALKEVYHTNYKALLEKLNTEVKTKVDEYNKNLEQPQLFAE